MNTMFETKVSVFKNFHSPPKTITLGQWLNICKYGSRYTKQVLEYRRLKDEKLKKNLPLVTVGAVCTNNRKLENVTTRTGWIALDIDAKDNPHLTDAVHIRNEVAKIKNVAFTGLSTGGAGVWALVKIANAERQADYFKMLLKDFEAFGIILDSSKGKNPNDARFYSYDSGAIIKDSFSIYKKLPPKPIRTYSKPKVHISNNYNRYAETAFKDELNILSNATKGNRNNQLFKSSASLAGLVAGGILDEHEIREALEQTALSIGLKTAEINATINSGFEKGKATPRTPQNTTNYSATLNHSPQRDSAGERKIQSQNLAPNGFNPFTGEIFDKRGYPASWDEIQTNNII